MFSACYLYLCSYPAVQISDQPPPRGLFEKWTGTIPNYLITKYLSACQLTSLWTEQYIPTHYIPGLDHEVLYNPWLARDLHVAVILRALGGLKRTYKGCQLESALLMVIEEGSMH